MLVDVRKLSVIYQSQTGRHHAVRDVSIQILKEEVVSLVGESGSGKSTVALTLGRLTDYASCRVTGEILFGGQDVLKMSGSELRRMRQSQIGYVFQEPAASLNPVFKIKTQIAESLPPDSMLSVEETLTRAHLQDASRVALSYPHELSGGMKQRVMIAMALAKDPDLLIADEPTTALDVTTQREILKLFLELKSKRKLSILFITHDLNIAQAISDRILVMKEGRIVDELRPGRMTLTHPYAQKLWNASRVGKQPKTDLDV
jgi:ABC-type dipeptide/oligopeptide/nickel transport system ATPase component